MSATDNLQNNVEQAVRGLQNLRDELEDIRAENTELRTDLALETQSRQAWQKRAGEAERNRDFYMRFATEIVTELTSVKIAASNLSQAVDDVLERAHRAAAQVPEPTLPDTQRIEQRR